MTLTLEITGPDAGKLGADRRKVFDAAGGTIGRQSDCAWVLQDPYVSGRHALIRYANGVYYIEDTRSRNGVFINTPDHRLDDGEAYALKAGDRILIEPYEIRVSLGGSSPSPDLDPFVSAHTVDPLDLLRIHAGPAPALDVPRADQLGASSLLSEHYDAPAAPALQRAPASASAGALIPDDYNPLNPDSQIIRPAPARAAVAVARVAPEPAPSSGGTLADVLAGAGLTNVPVTPELARNFGEILRVVVSGVMDVLQARQRIKDEFRIRVTTFKRSDNNPLKFSANVEDALHNLLVKRNAAYLAPVDAFDDAFDDIRNHQIAMLAGLRVAFEAMLAEFDPDRLQQEFDHHLKKSSPLLAAPAKLRYWDLYREKVHDMLKDAESSFRTLFGDEFAREYEEQLERLKPRLRPGPR